MNVQHLSDHTSVLHLEGPLRAPVSAELRCAVDALLRRGRRRIVLDLAGVPDLDAAGLGELVQAYTMTIAANRSLRIVGAFGPVRTLLRQVGLFDLLSLGPETAFGEDFHRRDRRGRQEPAAAR